MFLFLIHGTLIESCPFVFLTCNWALTSDCFLAQLFFQPTLPLGNLINIVPEEEAMPRRPTRCHRFPKPQPFIFSAFGLSVAASTFKRKCHTHNPNFKERVPSKASGILVQDHKCVTELTEFLIEACQEKDVLNKLRLLLGEDASTVELLVSQRVMNLPPQLFPPLYDALFDEVSWATEDEPTEELRDSFRFKFYLMLTRIYKHKNANQQKGTSKHCSNEPIIYIKPEDEIFHKLSSWSFSFPLQTQQLAMHELRNYRLTGLVMAVEANKIPTFRKELKSLISES
ncbi:hypothetical protein NE237_011682 [Protea cynaroides]|uniref:Uncharacterized protein n=1 Tax=Protea cynaroides TaxID=273540 RepID=A0A9Q0GWI8_9MAGN|nr:hypothetical protein NE237_011682 [Protea cynaroides]